MLSVIIVVAAAQSGVVVCSPNFFESILYVDQPHIDKAIHEYLQAKLTQNHWRHVEMNETHIIYYECFQTKQEFPDLFKAFIFIVISFVTAFQTFEICCR